MLKFAELGRLAERGLVAREALGFFAFGGRSVDGSSLRVALGTAPSGRHLGGGSASGCAGGWSSPVSRGDAR